jgi:hypothetical protein
MRSANTWPRGLRLIFWSAILAALTDTGQIAFYLRTEALRSLVGGGTIVALFLEFLCVVFGIARRRRLFCFAALGAAAFSFLATCYFQAEFVPALLQDVAAGRWPFGFDMNTWYYTWNSLCLLANAAVIFYIVRYELRFELA